MYVADLITASPLHLYLLRMMWLYFIWYCLPHLIISSINRTCITHGFVRPSLSINLPY